MNIKPCVVGLGYVGLPVLLSLSKKFKTCGFDINKQRIIDLKKKIDKTKEFNKSELNKLSSTILSSESDDLKKFNFYIICVPTPININKKPDLSPLILACKIIAKVLKKNDVVVFESTVYPGTTQDICVPIIEKISSLSYKKNEFFVCYSPERVNPGDEKHSINKINKIIAIPKNKKKKEIIKVYKNLCKNLIINENIAETETAKLIENIQRDLNIALMNEIFVFCKKVNLNFDEVLKLASTKWNFVKYKPGLVGGHCLPVDPYYFSYIAKKNNIQAKVTLSGRETNNNMKNFCIAEIKKELKKKNFFLNKDLILFSGLTYKKNVSDMRNSKAYEIFEYFKKNYSKVFAVDPYLSSNFKRKIIDFQNKNEFKKFSCIISLVDHDLLRNLYKKMKINKKIINIF